MLLAATHPRAPRPQPCDARDVLHELHALHELHVLPNAETATCVTEAARGPMPRTVIGGLIQAAAPITDPAAPIAKVRDAAIDAHIPFIEEAGKRGVQILGLQEV